MEMFFDFLFNLELKSDLQCFDSERLKILENILQMTKGLYMQMFEARGAYSILMFIYSVLGDDLSIFHNFPFFYSVLIDSLKKAIFMDIACLYDRDSHSANIDQLLSQCINKGQFGILPEYKTDNPITKYSSTILSFEKEFYEKNVIFIDLCMDVIVM